MSGRRPPGASGQFDCVVCQFHSGCAEFASCQICEFSLHISSFETSIPHRICSPLGVNNLRRAAPVATIATSLCACSPSPGAPRRYDKSAFQGRGDRADPSTWPVVTGPLELVFFEGWMSGFRPVGEAAAAAVEASLVEVDKQLAAYEAAWDSAVDAWLVIRIGDPQVRECGSGLAVDMVVLQCSCQPMQVGRPFS